MDKPFAVGGCQFSSAASAPTIRAVFLAQFRWRPTNMLTSIKIKPTNMYVCMHLCTYVYVYVFVRLIFEITS